MRTPYKIFGRRHWTVAELNQPAIPEISRPLLGGFQWFVRRYLRKHFHAVALNTQQLASVDLSPTDAMVVYANHASWWDPLTAVYMAESVFPQFRMYAPIDSRALAKYRMFAKLGFYPVEQDSRRGAAAFLATSRAILTHPAASIWMTPEGRFADPRDTSGELMPGLAHLAAQLSRQVETVDSHPRVWFVPAAVEYAFWEERQPELLVWFGKPIAIGAQREPRASQPDGGQEKSQWQTLLTTRLRQAQVELAQASIARLSTQFRVVLGGRSGSFIVYDVWRKITGALVGKKVSLDHGNKLRP